MLACCGHGCECIVGPSTEPAQNRPFSIYSFFVVHGKQASLRQTRVRICSSAHVIHAPATTVFDTWSLAATLGTTRHQIEALVDVAEFLGQGISVGKQAVQTQGIYVQTT